MILCEDKTECTFRLLTNFALFHFIVMLQWFCCCLCLSRRKLCQSREKAAVIVSFPFLFSLPSFVTGNVERDRA